ncbi:MAG: hypothetical protein JSR34_05280 [Proteobacteria bacterium]|nr:hypothetical protein [Pseudomonadota bacterium]
MPERPVLILVLGTQRSGTSAVARVLGLLGCAVPGTLLAADAGNPGGYWENAQAVAIDEDLLRALDRCWDDPRALPADWLRADATAAARARIEGLLAEDFADQPLSLLKDPRLCLLAPLWIQTATAAGFDVHVLHVLRDPRAVAASLARFSGMAASRAHWLWLHHAVAGEIASRGLPRASIHYEDLLADWRGQAAGIGQALGLTWPRLGEADAAAAIEAFLRPDRWHSSGESPVAADDPALALHARLRAQDADGIWRTIAQTQPLLAGFAALCDPLYGELREMADAAALRVLAMQEAVRERDEQLQGLRMDIAAERGRADALEAQAAHAVAGARSCALLPGVAPPPGSPAAQTAPRRIAIYLFHDAHGIVDDYVAHMLHALREHAGRVVVVCNGAPDAQGMALLQSAGTEVFVRGNAGFDVHGYRECIDWIGPAALAACDELLLLNYTFFGPIFPLAELFDAMQAREVDFWGITAHAAAGSPFEAGQRIPAHIQSHFIAVRARMLHSEDFATYWRTMPPVASYRDAIMLHEARFTEHFERLGYRWSVYMEPAAFGTDHPILIEVDRTIEQRCPILKRRVFFHDPLYHEAEAIDLRRAFDLLRSASAYPVELIWRNLVRTAPPRTLYTNFELLDVFPPVRIETAPPAWRDWNVAALVHLYYPEMAAEIGAYLANVPRPLDLIVTTDTQDKRDPIAAALHGLPNLRRLDVRVLASNAGRDTSALLIGCRDIVLDGGYDLVCRLHSKKSPQDGVNRAAGFRRHLLGNLLDSRGYVENLFDLLAREPHIGVLMPPVVHVGYPTLGHAWFGNRPRVQALADELGLRIVPDEDTPLAPLGSMYWFRPAALEPLFRKPWQWSEFEGMDYGDGDLPHAIERLIPYCAQARGYLTWCAMTARAAARNYVKLEYRHQALSACFPVADTRWQMAMVQRYRDDPRPFRVRGAAAELVAAMRRSLAFRIARMTGKQP